MLGISWSVFHVLHLFVFLPLAHAASLPLLTRPLPHPPDHRPVPVAVGHPSSMPSLTSGHGLVAGREAAIPRVASGSQLPCGSAGGERYDRGHAHDAADALLIPLMGRSSGAGFMSAFGGVAAVVHSGLAARASDVRVCGIARGRVLAVTWVFGDCRLAVVRVPLSLALSFCAKMDLLRDLRTFADGTGGCMSLTGDWNFTVPGGGRVSIRGGERLRGQQLGAHFKSVFKGYSELHQHEQIRRRWTSDSHGALGDAKLCRMDRCTPTWRPLVGSGWSRRWVWWVRWSAVARLGSPCYRRSVLAQARMIGLAGRTRRKEEGGRR